jgi:hypothetical protein
MRRMLVSGVLARAAGALGAGELGFPEESALAPKREDALAALVTGTPEYYFYHCLHFQNQGRLDAARKLLDGWIERHGRGERFSILVMREEQGAVVREAAPPAR